MGVFVILFAVGVYTLTEKPTPAEEISAATIASATPAPMFTPSPLPLTATPTISQISTPSSELSARLLIPAAAVSAPIIPVFLDGVSWDVSGLGVNVGHLQGTAWLDQPGNVVLSGHVELSDGRRGVFASLSQLAEGDVVIVQYGEVERRYRVIEITRVEPEDLTPVYPTTSNRLTLITCAQYDFFTDTYKQRVVVVAELVS